MRIVADCLSQPPLEASDARGEPLGSLTVLWARAEDRSLKIEGSLLGSRSKPITLGSTLAGEQQT